MDNERYKMMSPYRRGAARGPWMGLLLTGIFFSAAYTVDYPALSLVTLALMAAIPLALYFMLRSSFRADNRLTLFSALWMEGITVFICGGLIYSVITVIYMVVIQPGFIIDRVNAVIAFYQANPAGEQSQQMIDLLTAARDHHSFPRPVALAIDMLWLIVFCGSMLSLAVSALVTLGRKK